MLSILFGLGAALGWGAGDFTGGLASRKTGAYRAVFYSEVVGVFLLFIMLGIWWEDFPNLSVWLPALIAGAIGTFGLMLLYHAMTLGLMSISAPVSALLAAVLPVIVGAFKEGLPKLPIFIGFGFALAAVWLVSQSEGGVKDVMIAAYMLIARASFKVEDRSAWPFLILNGFFDIAGNVFFILSGQAGRLDVASVLSSLFSGVTVMLAWVFLKERLTRNQWIGVASALAAIVLMTM